MFKPDFQNEAERIFNGTGVQLTADGQDLANKAGQRHLGLPLAQMSLLLPTWIARWPSGLVKLILSLLLLPPIPTLPMLPSFLVYATV